MSSSSESKRSKINVLPLEVPEFCLLL